MASEEPKGKPVLRRLRWLRLPICGVILLLVIRLGCHTRRREMIGTWKWNDDIVRFRSDGTWAASKEIDPHYSGASGNWTINGNSVTLSFFSFEPPKEAGAMWTPDDHFTLSADGRRLTGTEPESGTMIKL